MFVQTTETPPAVSISLVMKNNISSACFKGRGNNCRRKILSGVYYTIWCYLMSQIQIYSNITESCGMQDQGMLL